MRKNPKLCEKIDVEHRNEFKFDKNYSGHPFLIVSIDLDTGLATIENLKKSYTTLTIWQNNRLWIKFLSFNLLQYTDVSRREDFGSVFLSFWCFFNTTLDPDHWNVRRSSKLPYCTKINHKSRHVTSHTKKNSNSVGT